MKTKLLIPKDSLLNLILCPLLVFSAQMAVHGQFTYITNNGTITITGYYGDPDVTIPATIDGLPVTGIGDSAFSSKQIVSVSIPNSVRTIGDSAFHSCGSLMSVMIPNSVTFIGNHAFASCVNLANLTIGSSVTTIGDFAFSRCPALSKVILPNTVTNIGANAFEACTGLADAKIGNGVSVVGDSAFAGCLNLGNRHSG